MGKGNFILGYGSGSIGDVTFARSKGQQVVRARNRKPNNPRSRAQMLQRTLFMGPVKFYRDAVQNLFKFAFEDKTEKESDYNAFMRHNSKLGYRLTKDLYENPGMPVITDFYMSKGSLSTSMIMFSSITEDDTRNVIFGLDKGTATTAPTTIGDLSKILIASDNRMVGDIITIVIITKDHWIDGQGVPKFLPRDPTAPKWQILQFVVDPTSTVTLASLGWSAAISGSRVNITVAEVEIGEMVPLLATSLIVSRNTPEGLRVTNSKLGYDENWSVNIETLTSDEWTETVLASWNASEEAILKGGLAD